MVPLDHFIPDELPLMLRITDILLINLILDFKDTDDHLNKNVNIPANVEFVCGLVQSCGVTFYICTPKGSSELEWTSLSGNEKMKILKLLSESDVLNSNSKEKVVELWQDFYNLYVFLTRD